MSLLVWLGMPAAMCPTVSEASKGCFFFCVCVLSHTLVLEFPSSATKVSKDLFCFSRLALPS